MPPRIAPYRRFGLILGAFSRFAGRDLPAQGQELQLQRVYPGSGPYVCASPVSGMLRGPVERAAEVRMVSDAHQGTIVVDVERVEDVLSRAADLDLSPADTVGEPAKEPGVEFRISNAGMDGARIHCDSVRGMFR